MTDLMDRVAGAPISWGICEVPGWGLQLPVDRVLAEAAGLGLTAMEQGALGWLPTDPYHLRSKLDAYGMSLVGGFVPLVLHDRSRREEMRARAEQIASTIATAGGHHFVTALVADLDDWSRPDLDADALGRPAHRPRRARRRNRRSRHQPGAAPARRHAGREGGRARSRPRRVRRGLVPRHRSPHDRRGGSSRDRPARRSGGSGWFI